MSKKCSKFIIIINYIITALWIISYDSEFQNILKYRKKYIRWIVYFSLNQGGVFLIKNWARPNWKRERSTVCVTNRSSQFKSHSHSNFEVFPKLDQNGTDFQTSPIVELFASIGRSSDWSKSITNHLRILGSKTPTHSKFSVTYR